MSIKKALLIAATTAAFSTSANAQEGDVFLSLGGGYNIQNKIYAFNPGGSTAASSGFVGIGASDAVSGSSFGGYLGVDYGVMSNVRIGVTAGYDFESDKIDVKKTSSNTPTNTTNTTSGTQAGMLRTSVMTGMVRAVLDVISLGDRGAIFVSAAGGVGRLSATFNAPAPTDAEVNANAEVTKATTEAATAKTASEAAKTASEAAGATDQQKTAATEAKTKLDAADKAVAAAKDKFKADAVKDINVKPTWNPAFSVGAGVCVEVTEGVSVDVGAYYTYLGKIGSDVEGSDSTANTAQVEASKTALKANIGTPATANFAVKAGIRFAL